MNSFFLEALRQTLPPTFSRKVAADALKGVFSAGRLANRNSRRGGVWVSLASALDDAPEWNPQGGEHDE